MNHFAIQKLISSVTQEPGFLRLRRLEDETLESLKRRRLKIVTNNPRTKTNNNNNRARKNVSLEDKENDVVIEQSSCSLCGVYKNHETMSRDVLEFEILLAYFPAESAELCQIAQYCNNCRPLLTRLRSLHASLLKIKEDLQDCVDVFKIAFKQKCVAANVFFEHTLSQEEETLFSEPEEWGQEMTENEALDFFQTNSTDSEDEVEEKPFLIYEDQNFGNVTEYGQGLNAFQLAGAGHEVKTDDSELNEEIVRQDYDVFENDLDGDRTPTSAIVVGKGQVVHSRLETISQPENLLPSKPTEPSFYKCDDCELVFGRLAKLKSHKSVAHGTRNDCEEDEKEGPKEYIPGCEVSPASSDWSESDTDSDENGYGKKPGHNRSNLDARNITGNYTFTCHICLTNFKNGKGYENHYQTVHPGERFHCLLHECSKNYAHVKDLRRHRRRNHCVKNVMDFYCPDCDEFFENEANLEVHYESSHNMDDCYRCRNCDAEFETFSELTLHYDSDHKQGKPVHQNKKSKQKGCKNHSPKNLSCGNCLKHFPNWTIIIQHFKKQHLKSRFREGTELVYKCSSCLLFSLDYETVLQHLAEEHPAKDLRVHALLLVAGHEQFIKIPICDKSKEGQEPCSSSTAEEVSLTTGSNIQMQDIVEGVPETNKTGSLSDSSGKYIQEEQHPNVIETISDNFGSSFNKSVNPTNDPDRLSNIRSCRLCQLDCLTTTTLERHFKLSHPGQIPFSCKICQKTFSEYGLMKAHIRRVHKPVGDFVCETCGQRFYSKSPFDAHIKKHKEEPQNCSVCNQVFPTAGELQEHGRVVHEGKKPRPYVCRKCPAYFEKAKSYYRHNSEFHPAGDWNPKDCATCGRRFKFRIRYETHIHKEDGKIAYRCECGKECKKPEQIESHIAKYHEGKPLIRKRAKTQCEHCGLVLLKGHLRQHMVNAHSENPEARKFCSHCNLSFPSFTSKEIHDREAHRGLTLHKCYFCSKSFAVKALLEYHIQTHTKEGLECRFCKKIFSNDQSLKGHMATVCGNDPTKKAKRLKRNRENMAKYRAKKPYSCGNCGERFSQKPGLTSHERKCTGS